MADDETPENNDAAAEGAEPTAEGAEAPQHAVPSEEAQEIAGSAEDAALEAAEEAREAPAEHPASEPAMVEPSGEGHAVPTDDAQEIAGSAEDAALEALQESQDATAVEAAVDEDEDEGDDADVAAPRQTGVPGAHLEVDIVPEGVDPLGAPRRPTRTPMRADEEDERRPRARVGPRRAMSALSEPIATAPRSTWPPARATRATGKRKTAIARVIAPSGQRHLPRQRAHARASTSPATHFSATFASRSRRSATRSDGRRRAPARRWHLGPGRGACATASRVRCSRPTRTCAASSSAAAS